MPVPVDCRGAICCRSARQGLSALQWPPSQRLCCSGNDPLCHRRRHRAERDGDDHLSRLFEAERAQELRQGLHAGNDLHARHAGGRHAAGRRPGRSRRRCRFRPSRPRSRRMPCQAGLSIISDNYQDGHAGYATNTFFVLQDSPIKTVADLKGKKVGINAFGSAVDLVLRVVLEEERPRSASATCRSSRSTFPTWRPRSAKSASIAAFWLFRSWRSKAARATCGRCSPAATLSARRR